MQTRVGRYHQAEAEPYACSPMLGHLYDSRDPFYDGNGCPKRFKSHASEQQPLKTR